MRSMSVIVLPLLLLTGCAPVASSSPSSSAMTAEAIETPTQISSPAAEATSRPFISIPLTPAPPIGFSSYAYDRLHGELIQFGGIIPFQCIECNATWAWDGTIWRQRQPEKSPPGRSGAAFVYDEALRNSVLFGSPAQLVDWINDTWTWDGENWIEEHPATAPSPRAGSQMVYDPDRQVAVLFGGEVRDPKNSRHSIALNETWRWDGENWELAHPVHSPPAPEGVPWVMGYDRNHRYIVLFDGMTTWVWDGADWTQQIPTHSPEVPFYGVMGYDETTQQLVLVGETLENTVQTWLWDGKDWIQVETHLQGDLGVQLHLFFDTKHQVLLLYAVNSDKAGVTGSSMWAWKDNDWTRIY